MSTADPIPAAPGAYPLLGHLLPLLRDPQGFLVSLPGHGDLVKVRFGPISAVVVCSPDLHVISETLRLYTPGWMFGRIVTADTQLGEHQIPAGTSLVFSPYLIHHTHPVYDHPESFDIDRWAKKEDSGCPQPDRYAYVPFIAGARKCMGDNFAVTEATLALATIAARWQLEPLPGQQVRAVAKATLRPRGLRMRAVARTAARPGDTSGRSPRLPVHPGLLVLLGIQR